jgi:hypothetical protein
MFGLYFTERGIAGPAMLTRAQHHTQQLINILKEWNNLLEAESKVILLKRNVDGDRNTRLTK